MSFPHRRTTAPLSWLLFFASWLTYAWFNQGGGWNQNSRFAEVRAMAEAGAFAIDPFFAYHPSPGNHEHFDRPRVEEGTITRDGQVYDLTWTGSGAPPTVMAGANRRPQLSLDLATVSGDVSFAQGHFHPNKPPGTSFVALPAYWTILHLERALGLDPDDWWTLNCNLWLSTVFSVGLIAALGVVLFFRLAVDWFEGNLRAALAAAIGFGWATMMLPFGTVLFDHDVAAVALLAAFAGLYWATPERNGRLLFLAGLAAGLAAITNYLCGMIVWFLGAYLWSRRLGWRSFLWFGGGLAGPFVVICGYNFVCYGSPFALSNSFQNPVFNQPLFLGMFGVPRPELIVVMLFSSFRGIFYSSPYLLLAILGGGELWRKRRAEFWLFLAIFLFFLVTNSSFNGWHAGFTSVPRYLIPAVPFLALAAGLAVRSRPRLFAGAVAISFVIQFLHTAVDVQSPVGIGWFARTEHRPIEWEYNPLTEYTVPLFCTGRAWPLLEELIAEHLEAVPPEDRDEVRHEEEAAIDRGDKEPFVLAAFHGPVSVNLDGAYEGGYFQAFSPRSEESDWNSFNVGEFLFPQSRWSVVPLLLALGLAGGLAWQWARREC